MNGVKMAVYATYETNIHVTCVFIVQAHDEANYTIKLTNLIFGSGYNIILCMFMNIILFLISKKLARYAIV